MVVVGAGVGGGLRFLVAHVLPPQPDGFPWATLIVNIVGSFALGVISGLAIRSTILSRPLLLLLGTGLCGGFTTFSTFSLESLNLYREGHVLLLLAYVGGSMVGGLGAAAAGLALTKYETP